MRYWQDELAKNRWVRASAGCYGSGEGDSSLVAAGGDFRRSCLRVGITRHEKIWGLLPNAKTPSLTRSS